MHRSDECSRTIVLAETPTVRLKMLSRPRLV